MDEGYNKARPLQIIATDSPSGKGAESYRVSLDLLPDAAILFARDGTILQVNEAARVQMEANSIDDLIGKNIYAFGIMSDDLRASAVEGIFAGKTIRFEMGFQTLKGKRRLFEVLDVPLRDSTGAVETVLGFSHDITEQRRAEAERDRLAAAVNSSNDAIITISPDLRIMSWNPGAENMLGFTAAEAVGQSVELFLAPKLKDFALKQIAKDMETMRVDKRFVRRLEVPVRRKDGSFVEVSIVAAGLYAADGQFIGACAVHRDITESKRAERERDTLAAIVNASEDAIIGYSSDLRIASWNPTAERIYGYSASEAIGRGFDLFVTPEELQHSMEASRQVLETGQPVTFEQRARRKDGSPFTWSVNLFPVRDTAGNIVAGAGIGRDITELKRIQEELRAAQVYTRGLIESSIDAMVVVNRELRITDINEQFARLTEVPKKILIGSRFDANFTEPERAREAVNRTLADGFVANFDLVLRAASGREIQASFNASIFHRDGKVFGIFGVAHDVTEQRTTERTLREEREYSRSLVESSPDAFLVCDTNLILTDINEQAMRLTGFERPELVGVKLPALFAEPERVSEVASRSLTSGLVRDVELTLVTKRAERVPVSINASVFRDGGGGARGVMVAVRDVSERKRFESERMLLASIVDTTGDAIFTETPDLTITSWNAAAEKLFGYAADEAIGRNAALLVPLERRAELTSHLRALESGSRCERIETVRLRKGGTPVDVALTASAISDSQGRLSAVSITAHDIRDRKRIEAELTSARDAALEAARLKSEFLANMSHEIRTPLNSIIGMTGLLLDSGLTPEQSEYAGDVRESGEALLTLINEILDFSKIAVGKLVFEDINFELRSTVEGAVEIVSEQARRKGLELILSIDPEAPHLLHGDPARLRQVLLNLVGNAIKFTERGEVEIAVNKLSENPQEAILRFEVRDTGIGIPENKKHLLFQPFTQLDASTSRHFGGTGLGLSIAREIVERMGGAIAVTSTEGVGSTFWFTARFGKQRDTAVPVAEQLASLVGQRVIVVDDNANSRKIVGADLASWGMDVISAENATAAIGLMRSAPPSNPIKFAVIDVMMPEVDGIELARIISTDPALKATHLILISSAGSRNEFSARLRGIPVGAWLMKPVPQSTLYNAVLKLAGAGSRDGAPQKAGQPATNSNLRWDAAPAARHKLKVLLAEDNPLNQKVALLQLHKLGVNSDCVANGREAAIAAARLPYDLIFMDCQMPEMDGYEATREIRRNERGGRRTRIVAMTAHALEGDREKCLDAGMDDYISKPVDLAVLEKAIRAGEQTLDSIRPTTAAEESAPENSADSPVDQAAPEQDEPPKAKVPAGPAALRVVAPESSGNHLPVLDPDTIADLRAEGVDLLDELIGLLLDQLPAAVSDIAEAAAQNDLKKVAFQAHRLKGSAGNMGARKMSELCQSIEAAAKSGNGAQVQSLLDSFRTEAERLRGALLAERSRQPGASAA